MTTTIERERGLYRNGVRWWLRIRGVPRSTGTSALAEANLRARWVRDAAKLPRLAEWVDKIVAGEVALDDVYRAHAEGRLHLLADQLKAKAAADADADLSPWVDRWGREYLDAAVANGKITRRTADDYLRQVRRLIPEGKPFPKSKLTESFVRDAVTGLGRRYGGDASGSTRRRHVVAWQLFYQWARKRVPLEVNPFEDAGDWLPANGAPRMVVWDHQTVLDVLDRMTGEERVAATLIFGTGLELGAVVGLTGASVSRTGEQLVTVGGDLKNGYRDDRTVFVSDWAWGVVKAHAATVLPRASLWSDPDTLGDRLRDAFYAAQVAAGATIAPPKSQKTGKPLWGRVAHHTLHDARHTFGVTKLLGLDGEPRQDLKWLAGQYGHADEQMAMKVYTKLNVRERLKLIELREARETNAKAAQAAGGK